MPQPASYNADDVMSSMKKTPATKKAPASSVNLVGVERGSGAGGETSRSAAEDAARSAAASAPSTIMTKQEPEDMRKRQIRERRERNERFDAQRYSANQWSRPYLQAERIETIQERVRTTPFRYSVLRSEAERFPEPGAGKAQKHSGWNAKRVSREAGPGSFNPKDRHPLLQSASSFSLLGSWTGTGPQYR